MNKQQLIAARAESYREQTPEKRCGNCEFKPPTKFNIYCEAISVRGNVCAGFLIVMPNAVCSLWTPEKQP